MIKLFTYGTLQHEDVQENLFGRVLKGTPEKLIGYVLKRIQIEEEFGCIIDDKEIATLLQWGDLIGYITDSQDPAKIKKK